MEVRKSIALVGLILVVSAVGCGRRASAPTKDQAEEYKAKAEPIIKGLEAHYAKHGRYPATVEEIGQQHFETPFGPSRYEVMMEGQMCQLMVGRPETSGDFELHWTGMGKDSPKFPQKWTFVVHKK